MPWAVKFHDAFEEEFAGLAQDVQDELLATAKLLQDFGPKLGRPHVDTLKGSDFANMKELRFKTADGEWRTAFALDPNREAIFWSQATNPAGAKASSTNVSSPKRTSVTRNISTG